MKEKKTIIVVTVLGFFIVVAMYASGQESAETWIPRWEPLYRKGCVHYENNELEEAMNSFKEALKTIFPDISPEPLMQDEKTLIKLFHGEKTAALARYQQGLFVESEGRPDEAATLFRDTLTILLAQEAVYVGYKEGCKSCHFKEWKSWKNIKMAKAMDSLKPGGSPETIEIKKKFDLDPLKDYTQDPSCLECHTTGFGLPGGYLIPKKTVPYKIRKAAEQTAGITCEACHGPGSKYSPVHSEVDENARLYRQEEFYAVGENEINADVCTRCHNLRNPTAGPDYKFDFEESLKTEGALHEHFELMYRIEPPEKKQKNDPKN